MPGLAKEIKRSGRNMLFHGRERSPFGGAAETQRGSIGFNLTPVTEDDRKVDLHLFAKRRLKANHRIRFNCFEAGNVVLKLTNPTGIPEIPNLAQQHRGRYPVRLRRLDPS